MGRRAQTLPIQLPPGRAPLPQLVQAARAQRVADVLLIKCLLCAQLPMALAVLSCVCWEQRCLIAESLHFTARFCYFFTLTICLKRCDLATDGTGVTACVLALGRTALFPCVLHFSLLFSFPGFS